MYQLRVLLLKVDNYKRTVFIFGRFVMNDRLLEQKIERFFLLRLRDQLKYMPINEALDFNDRKEIQKMIRTDIGSKRFRQEIDKAFRQDFDDALRTAFGVQGKGKMGDHIAAKVSAELGGEVAQKQMLKICKKVIEKFYKEFALRYPLFMLILRI